MARGIVSQGINGEGAGGGVSSLQGQTGALTLHGVNITISGSGQDITLTGSAGGGSIPQSTFNIIG